MISLEACHKFTELDLAHSMAFLYSRYMLGHDKGAKWTCTTCSGKYLSMRQGSVYGKEARTPKFDMLNTKVVMVYPQ